METKSKLIRGAAVLLCLLGLTALLAGCARTERLNHTAAAGAEEDYLDTLTERMSVSGDAVLYTGAYTDAAITDGDEAIASLAGLQEAFGLSDPETELTVGAVFETGDETWYRLQQCANGIPVYGRYLTVMTGADGTAHGVLGNTLALGDKVADEPELDAGAAAAALRAALGESCTLSADPELVYYTLDGGCALCYQFAAAGTGPDGAAFYDTVFVDSATGELAARETRSQEAAVSYPRGNDALDIDLSDGTYSLSDTKRHITVNNRVEETLSGDGFFGFLWKYDAFTGDGTLIRWDEGSAADEDALLVMESIEDAYDYFQSHFSYTQQNNGSPVEYFSVIHVVNLNLGGEGQNYTNNAMRTCSVDGGTELLAIGQNYADFNIVCHEFSHGVVSRTAGLSGALDEAYADVFAELIEAAETGTCDWVNLPRSIVAPYGGGISHYDDYSSEVEIHDASTLISHAAYLMNRDGVDYDALGQLWFNTLLLCSPGTSLQQFCFLMEAEAGLMTDTGLLTEAQLEAVKQAFEQVGLTSGARQFFVDVTENPTLRIYNRNGHDAVNVDVVIAGVSLTAEGGIASAAESSRQEYPVDEPEPVETTLGRGAYRITVSDRGSGGSVFGYVVVRDKGEDEVEIFTEFTVAAFGKVTDKESGAAVSGAVVRLYDEEGGTLRGVARTGAEGRWSLRVACDDYFVTYEHSRYESADETVPWEDFGAETLGLNLNLGTRKLVPLVELPYIFSTSMGVYGDTVYSLPRYTLSEGQKAASLGLTLLEIEPLRYDGICSFLFYRDKLYYTCKDSGTSGYRIALCRCNPDGSEQELLLDKGLSYTATFYITNGRLYPWSGTSYLDLDTNQWLEDAEYSVATEDMAYNAAYCVTANEDGLVRMTYTTGDNGLLHYGDFTTLVTFENPLRCHVQTITETDVYYTYWEGNYGYLYRCDLTTGERTELDSHPLAGGGSDGYYNW